MSDAIRVVPGGVAEIDTLVLQRRAMFADMGHADAAKLDAMASAFKSWVAGKLENGEYLAWLAQDVSGAPVGGLALWLMDWPPHMVGRGSRRGNILNVYTRPENRRQGIARRLMQVALDWCRSNQIDTVILHSSNEGRPLYDSLGFQPTNEMRLHV